MLRLLGPGVGEPRHLELLVELEAGLLAARPDDRSEDRARRTHVEIGLGTGRELERGLDHRSSRRDVAQPRGGAPIFAVERPPPDKGMADVRPMLLLLNRIV